MLTLLQLLFLLLAKIQGQNDGIFLTTENASKSTIHILLVEGCGLVLLVECVELIGEDVVGLLMEGCGGIANGRMW